MFSSQWHTILAIYSLWDYGKSLVLSGLPNSTRVISLHYVSTSLLFPFNNCTLKNHLDTLPNISRHKPYFQITCEICFVILFSQQRCRCFTVRWEFGYWTACNNVKRYCTLPYCDYVVLKVMQQYSNWVDSISFLEYNFSTEVENLSRFLHS